MIPFKHPTRLVTSRPHARLHRGSRQGSDNTKASISRTPRPAMRSGTNRMGSQVWPHATHEPMRTTRSTRILIPRADFGPATSVATNASWLEESLIELAACPSDALDEGLEEPSQHALEKTMQFLREISSHITERPDIYPMDEGSIAIDFRNSETKAGVLFLVERNGSGALFHRTSNSKGRLRVDDAADLLPEGGLMELTRVGIK